MRCKTRLTTITGQGPLWTHSMRCLAYAQFMVYGVLYMLLPVLPLWMVHEWGCSYVQAGWITALMAPAMWLPGVFHSYLIDTFPRKSVGMWGIFGVVAATVGMLYAPSLATVVLWRVVQGMSFGVATMTVGSTLAIDVAPSTRRTDANAAFVRIARVAMAVGAALGYYLYAYDDFRSVVLACAVAGGMALVCLAMVSVPFRAPLHAPLCSLDRFFLPRAWVPMANLVPVVAVAGVGMSRIHDIVMYAVLVAGILSAWAFWRWALPSMPCRAGLELGQAAAMGGFLILSFADFRPARMIGVFMVAAGVCLSASHLFIKVIESARHCERGSANNSYQLLWELGMMAGVGVATSMTAYTEGFLYLISAALSLLALLLYEVVPPVTCIYNIIRYIKRKNVWQTTRRLSFRWWA